MSRDEYSASAAIRGCGFSLAAFRWKLEAGSWRLHFLLDHYRTIANPSSAEIKVERSRFIANAFRVTTDEDLARELAAIQKKAFDATHHCWAFRLWSDGVVRSRSSDAGEPSGTAGRPILQAIESEDLFDVGVVVVRYFGGIKLGTGGLARAYRDSAQEVLRTVIVEDRYAYQTIEIDVPFAAMGTVYRLISPPDVLLDGEAFGETNVFTMRVRRSLVDAFVVQLTEKRLSFVKR